MPSARPFALLRDTVRNHPVIVASSAASAGVLLGAFVAVQLLATPQSRADSGAAPPAAVAAKAKPVPETTGSAPTDDRTATVDCDKETWPNLSPPCVEKMRIKHRARVVSTDKLDKPAVTTIETSPAAQPESKPAAPAVAEIASVSAPPVDLASAPSAVFAAPESPPAALTSAAPEASQATAEVEVKKQKRGATKSKRKAKAELKTEPKAPARQGSDDDDDTTTSVASSDSDDRAFGDRSGRRVDRRRIVERWTERDYDVPASNGDSGRRVTVIRRNGGGLFEGLFGN